MRVLVFSASFVWKLVVLRKLREIWSNVCMVLHVNYPLFLSDFNETLIFSGKFPKSTQIPNLMKIRPVGAKLFHAKERTDRETDSYDEVNSRV
jgi:hypothetical protein